MRIKVDRLIFLLCESVFCVFILARPVAGIFTHDMIKYIANQSLKQFITIEKRILL